MLNPKVSCKKCRNKFWSLDVIPLAWKCAICGNGLYFRYGTYFQQIEDIIRSRRGNDFVLSPDKKAYQAKASLDIKKIRYNRYLHRKQEPSVVV